MTTAKLYRARAKKTDTEEELTDTDLPKPFPELRGVTSLHGIGTLTGKKEFFTVNNSFHQFSHEV